MAAFYRQVLETGLVKSSKSHSVLADLKIEIVIHGLPHSLAQNIEIGTPPAVRGTAPVKLVFSSIPWSQWLKRARRVIRAQDQVRVL